MEKKNSFNRPWKAEFGDMKKVVILSGAGISAESGISTFRDSGGLWEQHDVMDVASVAGWKKTPALVLEFYNLRRSHLEGVEPNRAHFDIAALEKDYDVVVITQNVDNLHEKAGSSKVIHLHGELTKVRPEDSYTETDVYDESRVKDIGYSAIEIGDVDERGVQYRPHIVFFGEAVPKLSDALRELVEADIMIIVGTSLVVQPAASLWQFTPVDCPVYVVDPEDTPIDSEESVIHIKDKATTGVARAIEMLNSPHKKEIDYAKLGLQSSGCIRRPNATPRPCGDSEHNAESGK